MNDESHVNDPDTLLDAAYDGNYDPAKKLLSQGAGMKGATLRRW
jgi:hypothetical protein